MDVAQRCSLACVLALTAPLPGHAQTPAAQPAQFSEASSRITIDGRLEESAWLDAVPVTTFFETYPRSLAEPSVRTEVRFLYDSTYVYVGITAEEPEPAGLRSRFVRRDTITADQDYVEVYLDPLNNGRNAFVFTTNPLGVLNDGLFSEDDELLDTRPDFDFDVQSSVGERAWTAEFRIPLSTFRYEAGRDQVWGFAIFRNRPRATRMTIQSIPEPRQATCTMCFFGKVRGISIAHTSPPLYVTPQATYSHTEQSDTARLSLDAKLVPRSDTVIDLTVQPDFSQVEADDLQLTANAQFALALKEKRPFFLEGLDLLSVPTAAVYTRSFAEPQAGLRITHRGEREYSALVLRDHSGGLLLEPGALSSGAAAIPVDSTAALGRYRQQVDDFTFGALASARVNDGPFGGENFVYGLDGVWSPTSNDRITAQVLMSSTTNPNQPSALPTWDGRHFDGEAYYLGWQHASDRWYATVADTTYSNGFRAWNGFVPQVDVSSLVGTTGLTFYREGKLISQISPALTFLRVSELGGSVIGSDLSPSVSLTLPLGVEATVSWSPNARNTTGAGMRSYDYWSVMLAATPAPWMPSVSLMASFGDGIDFTTGEVNRSRTMTATVPLRLMERLEFVTMLGYQSQDSRDTGKRLFSQQNSQFGLLWHFSSKLYAQAQYLDSQFTDERSQSEPEKSRSQVLSALLSYQANWQTRYFIGLHRNEFESPNGNTSDLEIFAKVSFLLSKWK